MRDECVCVFYIHNVMKTKKLFEGINKASHCRKSNHPQNRSNRL